MACLGLSCSLIHSVLPCQPLEFRFCLPSCWELPGPGLVVGASSSRRDAVEKEGMMMTATWSTTLTLKGLRLSPTMMLVFELYLAKQVG